ncbi:MAG: nitroreductase family protein [Chitinispirillaceae bacterium]
MLEQLRTRRSVRSYTEQKIDSDSIAAFKEVLLRSPSSRRINPWEFIFVEEREMLSSLAGCKMHGSAFLSGAALGIVICADETKSDVWVEDCSIAAILLQMEAQNRGLGSCWIQIRNRQQSESVTSENYVRQLLSIPSHIRVDSIISIGHPAESHDPVPEEKLQREKIHVGKW